ncbi:MAG: tetratricopeptide repeat protein [Elusimicrobiota bacterium]|jgi:predicted negative regulator of RcsB-dependent stress response|nr:tetratricopeptide repeat protein [Elusimicrobiota bacterium]
MKRKHDKNQLQQENTAQKHLSQNGILDLAEIFLKKNKNEIFVVAALILVLSGAYSLYRHKREQNYQAQWNGLFTAELAYAGGEKPLSALEDFVSKNQKTEAGVYGALELANAYYQMKDYSKAEIYFKQAVNNGNKNMSALAEVSLTANLLAQNKYDEAEAQANIFITKNPVHFAVPQMLQYKALAQELMSKKAAAVESYTKITNDYPNTYPAAFAKMRLDILKNNV